MHCTRVLLLHTGTSPPKPSLCSPTELQLVFHLFVPNIEPPFPVQPVTEVQVIGSICSERKILSTAPHKNNIKPWATIWTQRLYVLYITMFWHHESISTCVTLLYNFHQIATQRSKEGNALWPVREPVRRSRHGQPAWCGPGWGPSGPLSGRRRSCRRRERQRSLWPRWCCSVQKKRRCHNKLV